MLVINEDGAFNATYWKHGVLLQAKYTEDIRQAMLRLHDKKWVIGNLAGKLISSGHSQWPYRMILKKSEWNAYLSKTTKDMEYTDLFEHLREQEDISIEKLKGVMGVLMHIDKGWRKNG
tara:strand:- start:1461 stop:1817 length:357 start_codon:yes stop_codon:yes gene_type:complete